MHPLRFFQLETVVVFPRCSHYGNNCLQIVNTVRTGTRTTMTTTTTTTTTVTTVPITITCGGTTSTTTANRTCRSLCSRRSTCTAVPCTRTATNGRSCAGALTRRSGGCSVTASSWTGRTDKTTVTVTTPSARGRNDVVTPVILVRAVISIGRPRDRSFSPAR